MAKRGGEMLAVRVAGNLGIGNAWARQTCSKDSSYESEKHGIWEDKVGRSDRNPMEHLIRDLRRGGTDLWGNRNAQDDPVMIARAFIQRELPQNDTLRQLWNAGTPSACNALVEALAAKLSQKAKVT